MKPIVLFVIDTLEVGGSEKSILAIAARLTLFEPVVCTIYPGNKLLPDFESAGIKVVQLDLPGEYNLLKGVKMLKGVIAELKPSIVHATLFRSEVISRLCLRSSSIPLIGSFVNEPYSDERYRYLGLVRKLKLDVVSWIDRFTAQWVSHFISNTNAISHTNARVLGIDPRKITVIYRGRSTNVQYTISESGANRIRREIGGSFTFLSVARLLWRKGLHEAIQAFALVSDKHPEARYIIAGEGPDRPMLEALIDRLRLRGRVHLLGTRSDVVELLAFADVFVFPSHYEGAAGAMIEAMFAAKPIIASDIEVVKETIDEDRTGLLFKLGNIDDLKAKMSFVIDNFEKCRVLGFESRKEAIRRFDISTTAHDHEVVYEKCIAKQGNISDD